RELNRENYWRRYKIRENYIDNKLIKKDLHHINIDDQLLAINLMLKNTIIFLLDRKTHFDKKNYIFRISSPTLELLIMNSEVYIENLDGRKVENRNFGDPFIEKIEVYIENLDGRKRI
ncbi:hypothetical protein ACJX0J_037073, partial [Zea mays]